MRLHHAAFVALLIAPVVGHDLWSRKRLHPSTVIGTLLLVLVYYGSGIVSRSDVGQMLVRARR